LARNENALPTYNDKIMIGQVRPHNYEKVNKAISEILDFLNDENNEMIVARMKELVPEFISKNSVYELLDDNGKKITEDLKALQKQNVVSQVVSNDDATNENDKNVSVEISNLVRLDSKNKKTIIP